MGHGILGALLTVTLFTSTVIMAVTHHRGRRRTL